MKFQVSQACLFSYKKQVATELTFDESLAARTASGARMSEGELEGASERMALTGALGAPALPTCNDIRLR